MIPPTPTPTSSSCRRRIVRLPLDAFLLVGAVVTTMAGTHCSTTTIVVQALPHAHRSSQRVTTTNKLQWRQERGGGVGLCNLGTVDWSLTGCSRRMTMTAQEEKRHKTRHFSGSSSFSSLHTSSSSFYSSSTALRGGGHVVPVASTSRRSRMVLSVSMGGSNEEGNKGGDDPSSVAQGRLLLFLVALLYGTLNVTLRLVYNTPLPDGAPISASALSAVRGWMATLCFIPLWLVYKPQNPPKESTSSLSTKIDDTPAAPPPSLWKAALELAVWNFGAQGLLNVGLLTTGSARAAFLTQLSVVMTPLISIIAGQVVPSTVWVASVLALAGLVLLSGGGAALSAMLFGTAVSGTSVVSSFGTGDLYVLGAALCWSLYLFRLSSIGRRFNDIELQASKTILLAILYTVWFVWGSFSSSGGMAFLESLTNAGGWLSFLSAVNPMIGLLLLYSALGPGTVADVIQTQGQSKVSSASEANVILSMEPVFAAVFAFFVLGEVTTLPETVGGGLILLAALVATRQETSEK